MAVKLALFQSLGTCPSCIDLLNMIEIGITSDNYVTRNRILADHQSGFRTKDSTVNQLLIIYNAIIKKSRSWKRCTIYIL
jgi:hypothetical protein